MKKYIAFILFIIVAVIFQSCTPYIYYPNAPNIPLPYSKHELKAGGGISTTGLYFDASYAVDSHLVVLGNYAASDLKSNYFGEIGGGYYCPVKNWFRVDVVSGFGIGKVSGNENVPGFAIFSDYPPSAHYYQYNNDYYRFMVQGDLGFFNKYVEGGFSFKVYNIYMRNTLYEKETVDPFSGYTDPEFTSIPYQSFFFEPAYFFNVGLKHVKFHLCIGAFIPFGAQKNFWNSSNLSFKGFVSEGIFVDLFQK